MPKAKVKTKTPTKVKKKRKASVKRTYRDHERIAAMTLCEEHGPREASRLSKIPETTIRAWLAGWRDPGVSHMYAQGRGQLADCFEKAAWEALHQARETFRNAEYKEAMKGACSATDKMLLLRGKPTHIGANTNTTANVDPIAALIAAARPEELDTLMRLMERATGASNANTISLDGSPHRVGEAGPGTAGGVHQMLLVDPEPRSAPELGAVPRSDL